MANIKLVGNSWEAEGIFDKTQNKTQKAINSEVVSKLSGIEAGAQVNRTYTATTGKPTANQTPSFGGTATVSQVTQDATGQISVTDRTIKIPSSTASTSAAGLMSAADKTALDTAVTNIGTISEMGTTATTLAGGIGELNDDIKPIMLSSYADITSFLSNANYDGFTRFCYIPSTFMSTLSQGKNNAIGIGYVSRTNESIADFVLRTGYDKIWTIRVSNGATTYVTLFFNSNLITNNYEPSCNATKAYAIGDIVNIANGELVRITRAISRGTAFVIGTNCESITVGKKLAEIQGSLNAIHKTYYSVTEMGLETSPKPTLTEVALAMDEGSQAVLTTSEVDDTEMTDNHNLVTVILIYKVSNVRMFAFGARSYATVNLNHTRLFYGTFSSQNSTWYGWREVAWKDITTYQVTNLLTGLNTPAVKSQNNFISIMLSARGTTLSFSQSWNTLFQLPVGIRPSANFRFPIADYSDGVSFYQGQVTTGGIVRIYMPAAKAIDPEFGITYLI